MAEIFVGDPSRVNKNVLTQLASLPDDYCVVGEANLSNRNIDLAIFRASEEHSLLMLTEMKWTLHPWRGTDNGIWEQQADDGTWQVVTPSNRNDRNPFWQAINTANALSAWLHNHQRLFCPRPVDLPAEAFRVWPNLLVLSPKGVDHQLPLKPSNGFGRWFFDVPTWLAFTQGWRQQRGVGLLPEELDNLIELIGLARWDTPATPVQVAPRMVPQAESRIDLATIMADLTTYLATLEQRVSRLEAQQAETRLLAVS